MIPDDQVEEVRARADIVDIVGEYVDLKKAGKEYKALCPFHDERTPSFYVVPDKGFYKCFGCGESGDAFGFLMKRGGLSFVDAVKHVAKRSGVEIRELRKGERPEDDPDRPLYELNAFARSFFEERLADPETGRLARDYLESRGVDAETTERFHLGYAPDEWRALRDAAARHGYDDALLEEAGLLSKSEKSPEPYDRFRDRIIFPIEALDGRVVAFGGRVLGTGGHGPKYLNSPETPIYHKGEVLYGLSWAKHAVRRESSALVVEGYMDLVALAAGGFDHVVATLGTAMTEEHARLLTRYTGRIYLLFDSDAAGLRATFKAGDTLLAQGAHPGVVTLPHGEDPDTLVLKEGAEGLRRYLDEAVDIFDRKLQILEEHDYFRDIERTRQAVDRLLPTIRATADPALRDIYVTKAAERTGVRRDTLETELESVSDRTRRTGHRGARGRRGTSGGSAGARRPARSVHRIRGMGAERALLLLLLEDRDWIERASERIGPDDFDDAANRGVFEALLEDPELDRPPPELDAAAAARLDELLSDRRELSGAETIFDSAVRRMKMSGFGVRQKALRERMAAAEDDEERVEIAKELEALSRERRALGADWSHTARRLGERRTNDHGGGP